MIRDHEMPYDDRTEDELRAALAERDATIAKYEKEAQGLRSSNARYELEASLAMDILAGNELMSGWSDYEGYLTEAAFKAVATIEAMEKALRTAPEPRQAQIAQEVADALHHDLAYLRYDDPDYGRWFYGPRAAALSGEEGK